VHLVWSTCAQCPLLADSVEKVVFRRWLKILRTAGASPSLRCEGPHQLPQKRSLALASVLQSLAAAEIVNALHLRDFRSLAIFEFFNTIGTFRTWSHDVSAIMLHARMRGDGPILGQYFTRCLHGGRP
jgi:hypothetical protein